ncbi:Alpha/Beta hydrolase protein [Rhodocollybia butyracea]|uniref:Alpha/Beta hydrolase protein n=1 Tax=Rhodocollybia butyracea TaxID=206335 RepID=A0A9P5PAL8_9AGAR|nr:Alpha/Beta hydrolase protein [Rhodocollybia butyracea]
MSVERRTVVYKTLHLSDSSDLPVLLDIYIPSLPSFTGSSRSLAGLIYFHGGGLTVGNRNSWFPSWLQKRITDAGHIFISPDYRLIPSGSVTAHEVLEDIKDVFRFIADFSFYLSEDIPPSTSGDEPRSIRIHIDPERIAVAGTSAGSLCAYLAMMHATPKPKAVFSMYGQGGNFLIPHYYTLKHSIFFRGREILDPALFTEFLYPACVSPSSLSVADSPNTYFPPDSPSDVTAIPGSLNNTGPPGFPSNRRMFLGRLYLQLGEFLDYYTGEHEPGLSAALRKEAENHQKDDSKPISEILSNLIPEKHRHLFPSLCTAYSSWSPVYFFHGSLDSAALLQESLDLHDLLTKAGIQSVMSIADGMEHSFDYQPNADEVHKKEFDKIGRWLDGFLRGVS